MTLDAPESCSMFCSHHGEDSCEPCVFVYYPLSPDLAAEKKAVWLGVCDECGKTEYTTVLPDCAVMAGEAHG